jgi:molybdate transport system substrate-binding protein
MRHLLEIAMRRPPRLAGFLFHTAVTGILALAVGACASAATPIVSAGPSTTASAAASASVAPSTDAVTVTVYAAASLKAAMDKVRTAYEAARPGTTLAVSTDSSAALETKIEQGAPADVFLSADTTNPQKLVDQGFAASAVSVFATNHLAIIVPTGNPAGIAAPEDLARPGLKIITAADSVPIARYTTQLIANLAKLVGYPTDYGARYLANVVSKEANVAAIVTKIELGEGDAAVVYQTDATATSRVRVIGVPDGANVPASYGGVVVRTSRTLDAAQAFVTWLRSADGQGVLASFGFLPPP